MSHNPSQRIPVKIKTAVSTESPEPSRQKTRRMYSSTSLQTQSIQEEVQGKKYRDRSKSFTELKDVSLGKENFYSHKRVPTATQWNYDRSDCLSLPTLPFLIFLGIFAITYCYIAGINSISQEKTSVSEMIIFVFDIIKNKLFIVTSVSYDYSWILIPVISGVIVTLVSLTILNLDRIGGEKIDSTPSLHLGEVTAFMNGILIFLLCLFYNLTSISDNEKQMR